MLRNDGTKIGLNSLNEKFVQNQNLRELLYNARKTILMYIICICEEDKEEECVKSMKENYDVLLGTLNITWTTPVWI